MKRFRKIILIMVVLLLIIVSAACGQTEEISETLTLDEEGDQTLLVYCGAGLKKPMNEMASQFQEAYNVKIEYTFAGSAQLLSQAELSKKGDVFIVGSMDSYVVALGKDLVFEGKTVAYHIPVIGVPKGNPANIQCLEDLAKPGVKVILGDENANAIGKAAQRIIKNSKLEDINANVIAKTATVNELGVHLCLGEADACITTLDSAVNNEDVDYIDIPKEINSIEVIPVGVLKGARNLDVANKFAEFVASDKGKAIFKKHGFPPVE